MNHTLSRAADILEQPNAWTQYAIARNSEGTGIASAFSQNACQWCALGAIIKAAGSDGDTVSFATNKLRAHLSASDIFYSISSWNDDTTRTQAEVVAALREAALT